jgi:hypothetical protein
MAIQTHAVGALRSGTKITFTNILGYFDAAIDCDYHGPYGGEYIKMVRCLEDFNAHVE